MGFARDEFDRLASEWGLAEKGWTFEVNGRLTSSAGMCYYLDRRVAVASWLTSRAARSEVIDTIRHEVAHALAWETDKDRGHGEVWKRWCDAVGARPEVTHDLADITTAARRRRR